MDALSRCYIIQIKNKSLKPRTQRRPCRVPPAALSAALRPVACLCIPSDCFLVVCTALVSLWAFGHDPPGSSEPYSAPKRDSKAEWRTAAIKSWAEVEQTKKRRSTKSNETVKTVFHCFGLQRKEIWHITKEAVGRFSQILTPVVQRGS